MTETFVTAQPLAVPRVELPDPPQPAGTPAPEAAPPVVLRACTVATRAQLPAVRVLTTSFLGHHRDGQFIALVVDADPDAAGPGVLTPADIGVATEELHRLATACTARELCAVLQPRLLAHLLAEGGPVLYLDPSVVVLDSVAEQVLSAAARVPVVLAPRVLRPLPRDGRRPAPEELLAAGTFDPGFLAVTPGAEEFLATWADQVQQAPSAAGAFLDGAPALVDHQVLRDPGIGVSAWNAAQRAVRRDEAGTLLVDQTSLRTVHFAGFDPQRPWLLSAELADRPRVLLSEHPPLAELCAGYRNDLVRAGHTAHPAAYRFGAVADGIPLPAELRREWQAAQNVDAPPPPAFGVTAAEFLRWACAPGDPIQAAAGGSRWAAALWREDTALQERYPDPFDNDAAAFREWCAGTGVATGRLHPNAVPRADAGRGPILIDQLGVSVVGSGPEADLLRAAVRASGLPSADEPSYPVVLRCAGAPSPPADRYVISVLPEPGARPGPASELWVASDTSRNALQRTGWPPVRTVPLPVVDRGAVDAETRGAARDRLGLADGVVFAATVDHSAERQGNALGLVAAFLAAFPDRHDVHLLLLVNGAQQHPEAAERLRLATASDPRIILVEETRGDALLDAADCVVSLHRAEGVPGDRTALMLASAATRGLPVLATEQGAIAELLGSDAAMLVPCHPGGREPDAQAAVRLLRAIADNPETAAKLGAASREYLLRTRGVAVAGEQIRERVEQAFRAWRTRRAAARHGHGEDPLRPLQSAKHALLRRADPGVESRMPMAPQLRKAVLRVLSHYDNHLREVLSAVVDGVERTASELARRQHEIESGDVGGQDLAAEVAELTDRQAQLDDQLVGVDDGVVRARADLAAHGRRMRAIEEAVTSQSGTRDKQVAELADRIDRLTIALDRTLDRIDDLESRVASSLRERDSRLGAGIRAAEEARRNADSLRRVVLREHQRTTVEPADAPPASVVLTEAGLMRLPSEDALMLPLLSSNGVWQPEVCALIDSLLEPDGVFVDVGAYVGYHSIRVLSRLGTSGAVVAVEPDATSRELLRRNAELNLPGPVAERLAVLDVAAWDTATTLGSRPALSGGIEVYEAEPDAEGERVQAVRLDKSIEALPEIGQLRLSVVKVNAPGFSHRALGGLVRLLRRDRPHVVCSFAPRAVTEQGADPIAVLQEFRVWGYELVPVGSDESREPADIVQLADARTGLGSALHLWLRPKERRS
ncbi:FkbM family methyltransferase [Crossiella sp. SN42]|uniref:FkbM family methyltransferase n=1 Tax=Crossiella sp. SN42 TaxID=2944808 RepID=UPI00207C419A|nr:FkbM family methyltransferase [Crossiella sp. SN42]MCO1582717.1 FkbM family methyltransferase [Crossiella sp. SN42]